MRNSPKLDMDIIIYDFNLCQVFTKPIKECQGNVYLGLWLTWIYKLIKSLLQVLHRTQANCNRKSSNDYENVI